MTYSLFFTRKLPRLLFAASAVFLLALFAMSCSKRAEPKEEQIRAQPTDTADSSDTTLANSIKGNLSLQQISATPNSVVLTGLDAHRLVTVYKKNRQGTAASGYSRSSYYYDDSESEREEHFMPGIDLIYGYNLLNIAHYDLKSGTLNFLFDHPVLIKALYYPSYEQDSIDKKPIFRDYYLVSAYDADTNGDTLINKKDLRRFYHFNASAQERTQLIPDDYSVVRSQYDPKNDVMYIFARHDENKNGTIEKKEPLHIFWFNLKQPAKAVRLY